MSKQNEQIYIDDFANYCQSSAQEITTLLSRESVNCVNKITAD